MRTPESLGEAILTSAESLAERYNESLPTCGHALTKLVSLDWYPFFRKAK